MNSTMTNRRGFVMIMSLLMAVFLGLYIASAFLRAPAQLRYAERRYFYDQALYVAEAGLEDAVFQLRRNTGFRPGYGDPLHVNDVMDQAGRVLGQYSVRVKDAGDFNGLPSVWVRAEGVVNEGANVLKRVIHARVLVENPASFFTSTLGDLTLQSGFNADGDILGRNIVFVPNTSDPNPIRRQISVKGTVYHIGRVSGHRVGNNAHPDVRLMPKDGNPATSQYPSITFPGVDLNYYRENAVGGLYDPDNLEITGPIDRTMAPNGLIFAEGDVRISGHIEDSVLVVAGGNIYITGDIKSNPGKGSPQLGLFAKKDVFITSSAPHNLSVEAFIVADGGAGSKGGVFKAEGGKRSKGKLAFNGAIAVRGDPKVLKKGETAIDLNVFDRRDYSYNPDLSTDRKIPFLTYIANIVRWAEVHPSEDFDAI